MEQSDFIPLPLEWHNNSWGGNEAFFSYLDEGHTGNHSVKTEITSYASGDAKWYYTPQPILPGKEYRFTDYYKSNTISRVVLMVEKNNGSLQYLELKSADPTTTWTKYSDTFLAPIDAKTISVFHLISSVGWLITDDYSIIEYQIQGFNRSLISLTFDDAWEQNIYTAFPILDQYGFKTSQYYCTQYIKNEDDKNAIRGIYQSGHEIGSHSVTHPFLTQLSDADLHFELTESKRVLEDIVGIGNINGFVTPYGDYNPTVTTAIMQYYDYNRNTISGFNSKDNLDIYNIRVQNMTPDITLAEFQSWIDQAITNKLWLVIVYHDVTNNPDPYDVSPENFSAQMQYLAGTGITVSRVSDALSELLPQL